MHWYMAMTIQWLFYNYTMIENYTLLRNESQPLKFLYFRQVAVSAKCLFGEKSVRHTVRSTKCSFDSVCRQNVRSAKCLSAKCLSAKCLSAKCPGTTFSKCTPLAWTTVLEKALKKKILVNIRNEK